MADGWEADGEMVRSAYTLRADDDDFGQPGTLVREVFNDAQRAKLVDQVAGSLLGGVREPVLEPRLPVLEEHRRRGRAAASRRRCARAARRKPAEGMGEG